MSNDLIKSIQNSLIGIQGGVDEDTRAIAGVGSSSKRISIKGGVFRKISGGKEIGAIDDRHMNVIFVKMAHNPSRTYYTGAYKEGEKANPICWSSDSKVPDTEVKNPQASKCDACPFSVKGSGMGGSGSACRLSWRTAVVLPNDPNGDVMQLVLPATSVFGKEENGKWPFREYVKMLANHNISAGRVVTKMQFDTKSPVPRVLFSPAAGINADDVEILANQAKSTAAENAVKLTVFQSDDSEVEVAAPSAPASEDAPPKVRETKKTAPAAADVADVLNEWVSK